MIFMESEHLKPGAQTSMTQTIQFRRLGRSIAAVLIGMAVGVLVTVGTDFALHAAGLFPPWDQRVSNALLLLATGYRTIYSVAASYLTAYLAPYRPLAHALVGGAFGFWRVLPEQWQRGTPGLPSRYIGIQSRWLFLQFPKLGWAAGCVSAS